MIFSKVHPKHCNGYDVWCFTLQVVVGNGIISFQLQKYHNPSGHTIDKQKCDSWAGGECDFVFTICLSITSVECSLSKLITKEHDTRTHIFKDSDTLDENGKVKNPWTNHFNGSYPVGEGKTTIEFKMRF